MNLITSTLYLLLERILPQTEVNETILNIVKEYRKWLSRETILYSTKVDTHGY